MHRSEKPNHAFSFESNSDSAAETWVIDTIAVNCGDGPVHQSGFTSHHDDAVFREVFHGGSPVVLRLRRAVH